MEKTAKKQALLMLAKNFGMNEEQVKNLFVRFARTKQIATIDDEIQALEKAVEEKRKEKIDCAYGLHKSHGFACVGKFRVGDANHHHP